MTCNLDSSKVVNFYTQISRVNLTEIRKDIGSDVESYFKEHLIGHKVPYSNTTYQQIINHIEQYYELWKPLENSICIDCEIIDTTSQEILNLKEKYDSLIEETTKKDKELFELKEELNKLNKMTNIYDQNFEKLTNKFENVVETIKGVNIALKSLDKVAETLVKNELITDKKDIINIEQLKKLNQLESSKLKAK